MEDKGGQNRVLRLLAAEGPMTQRALTERICIQPASASELLGKLEKSGLIRRVTSEADRRTVDVTLTRPALGADRIRVIFYAYRHLPLSVTMACPVMALDRSLARNNITLA